MGWIVEIIKWRLGALLLMMLMVGCAPYLPSGTSSTSPYTRPTFVPPYKKIGVASWYGRRFHQRRTSSGERYNMYAMTAAHRSLPLHSYVRVTNVRNRRSVVVRINDRGPFLSGRLIDVSYAAAKALGILNVGTARVAVETIHPGKSVSARVIPHRQHVPHRHHARRVRHRRAR